jgi:hypothetical protein
MRGCCCGKLVGLSSSQQLLGNTSSMDWPEAGPTMFLRGKSPQQRPSERWGAPHSIVTVVHTVVDCSRHFIVGFQGYGACVRACVLACLLACANPTVRTIDSVRFDKLNRVIPLSPVVNRSLDIRSVGPLGRRTQRNSRRQPRKAAKCPPFTPNWAAYHAFAWSCQN